MGRDTSTGSVHNPINMDFLQAVVFADHPGLKAFLFSNVAQPRAVSAVRNSSTAHRIYGRHTSNPSRAIAERSFEFRSGGDGGVSGGAKVSFAEAVAHGAKHILPAEEWQKLQQGMPGADKITWLQRLEHSLRSWAETSDFPKGLFVDLLCDKFDERTGDDIRRLKGLQVQLLNMFHHPTTTKAEALFEKIGVRGVLTLLGIRLTVGSVDTIPPSITQLMNCFNATWDEEHAGKSKKETLTTGGRAWTKHAIRTSDKWWGVPTGTDQHKNRQAVGCVQRVLADWKWLNIFTLPNDKVTVVMEFRNLEGYGARWTGDGKEFRGFLEPQKADGHANKWRH
eukprot:GDKI01017234.1.p1 GENE.GDKI01017234.1~~GDKI01017234.1.p1  ORF type:complete len:338 (-),score=94.43 GDKI01017234.1:435-1448(-)